MSAEILRRAAALMRERAESVNYPSPWIIAGGTCSIRCNDGRNYVGSTYGGVGAEERAAEHIASWHPAVALAVADWLESEALAVEGHAAVVATHAQMDDCGCAYKDCFECGMWCRCSHVTPKPRSASAVARAYLGAVA